MNHYKKNYLFLVCLILLISCGENQNLTEIPSNPVLETSVVQEEFIHLEPSITPEPYQRVLAGTPLPILETVISPENVNDIVELARWGNGIMQKIIVSSDGKFSVISSSIGFYIYSNEGLAVINFVELNSDVGGLALSPDDKTLAVGTRENVLVYEIENLHLIRSIERSATDLAFSPNGKFLAMGMGDWHLCREFGPIELWDVDTWTVLQTIDEADCIGDLIFSPSGKYLAVSNFDVRVWEIINEEKSVLKFTNWGCDVKEEKLAFTNDEEILIAETLADSGRDKICLIRMKDGKTIGILENDSKVDFSCSPNIVVSNDSRFMASNLEGKIVIWQVDEWKQLHTLGDGKECFYSGNWLPDNKTLITLSKNQLQLWDVPTEKLIYSELLSQQPLPIDTIEWSSDGKTIATGNNSGVVSLWQVSNGNIYSELENQRNITSLAFSPDNSLLAVGLQYEKVKIWDLSNKTISKILDSVSGCCSTSVAFSADGTWLALDVGGNSVLNVDDVQIWKTNDWVPILTLTAIGKETASFSDLSISSDNRLLAVTAFDDITRVWDISTKEIIHEFIFPKRDSILVSTDFSPNNKFLAVSKRNGGVGIWNLDNRELLYFYENPNPEDWRGIYFSYNYDNLGWSPDGQMIAVSMPNGSIHLIRASDGTLLKKLSGHTMWTTGVVFSPDGKMLASVSLDGTVRLWGIAP